MTKATINLLIVNQHGENRGDESAFKAMVRSFQKLYDCNITVIGQFRARDFKFPGPDLPNIAYLNMVMPVLQAALLLWGAMLKFLRLPPLVPNASTAMQIMRAYHDADLVISAPGGPYFGDLYRGHEPVHWLFILLGRLYGKPLYLYAPSAGPFTGSLFNLFRRYIYRCFRVVICRETESARYIEHLVPSIEPVVTADSALQEQVHTDLDTDVQSQLLANGSDLATISISVLEYSRLSPDQRENYEQAILEAIRHLDERGRYQFIFLPQLYGGYHSDVGYMESLISRLPKTIRASVLDSTLSSDAHRMIVANSELVIASRYHPQIFAASARTPFIAICYQHKSSAFMRDINMDEFALDIFDVNPAEVVRLVERCITDKDAIKDGLEAGMQVKEQLARQTTQLIVQDFEAHLCK